MKNYSINFVPACILAALWICLTTVDATEPKDVKKGASIPTLQSIRIEPPSIELSHARSKQSLVVTASYTDGSTRDVTSEAIAELSPKQLATWESEFLLPSSNGNGKVKFSFGGQLHFVPVVVKNVDVNPTVEFRNEVMQVLTKAGCNTGKCHGSASGKDGFRLSLFGYDPDGDHYRMTRELSGRRISLAEPERSLLMQKALGEVPHTGGQCIETESESYDLLRQWIREGAKMDPTEVPLPIGIEVFPKQSVFASPSGQQKLVVMANFSDGSRRDVSSYVVFLSNNDATASVDENGMVEA